VCATLPLSPLALRSAADALPFRRTPETAPRLGRAIEYYLQAEPSQTRNSIAVVPAHIDRDKVSLGIAIGHLSFGSAEVYNSKLRSGNHQSIIYY